MSTKQKAYHHQIYLNVKTNAKSLLNGLPMKIAKKKTAKATKKQKTKDCNET